MKIVKRLLLTVGILIFLLLAAAVIIPVFFKDKIMAVAKKQMNEQLNATADFKDVDISILRSFPRLSVSIKGLSIVGKDAFKSDTLISSESIDVALDLMKAIKGEYEILNVGLNTPRINAIVLEDGKANWDIAKPSEEKPDTKEESAPFAMKLRKYSIENGFIEYNDKQGKMHAIIYNLNHNGSGDFTSDAFTLATKTTADAVTFINAGVPYLNKVKTSIDLDLGIDNKSSKYTFNTDKIQLNGLKLFTKGWVQMPDTSNMLMDINFGTPSNDFKDILSLVPGIYTADFKDVKTTGKLALNGFVKGNYNATQLPSFAVNLGIDNGSFQYPTLPQKVSNIQVKLKVRNPDGVTDHTVIDLQQCHVELGAEPFDLRMLLRNPMTTQWIDAAAKGHVDLSRVSQFVTLEAGTKMAGDIKADVAVRGSMAQAQQKQFEKIDANGTIDINNLSYASKDYPDGVSINSLLLTFTPKNVTVANLKGKYLGTTFNGGGSVDNLIGYAMNDQTLTGSFNLNADYVDVNKFMGTTPTTAPTTTVAATPATDPFVVPANLDLDLKTVVGRIKYDNLELTGVSGGMSIRNEAVTLKDVTGKALDGTIGMTGSYSTKADKKNPDIAFSYSLIAVDVQKTFTTFNTVQKLMPAAKYISGKFSSQLTMTGKLDPAMSPNMNTLSGKGDMMLLGAKLSGHPVTDQLADKLKLSQFKTIALNDAKLFFEFMNGRVNVQPFKVKIGPDIEAEVAGSHGFDQTLNYGANVTVPRTVLGSAGNAMVSNLLSQATAKGLPPVNIGDKVNFAVKITGTSTKPKVETDLKSSANNAVANAKEEIKKEIDKKVQEVKNEVKDTVKAIKTQAVNEAKKELEKQLTGQGSGGDTKKVEDKAKEAADKAKEGLKGLFNKKK